MTLKHLHIDSGWSLFLDRDGVINEKLPGDYVKDWEEFKFLPEVPLAIGKCTSVFGKIFVVTNQQGIGKGIMTEVELGYLHDQMMDEIRYAGGRINKIYYSPYREDEKSVFRKPNIGMARKAKIDFPEIEFARSIMVGDSESDMHFGKNAGMYTVFIHPKKQVPGEIRPVVDFVYSSLKAFAEEIAESRKQN